MIVLVEDRSGLHVRRVRLADRLAARLRAPGLDAALARGEPPESTVVLAVHADALARPVERRRLAGSLRRLAAVGQGPGRARRTTPVLPDAVGPARGQLVAVADRLLSSGPVDVRGVAQLRLLLADGGGPIYRRAAGRDLRAELCTAGLALEPA